MSVPHQTSAFVRSVSEAGYAVVWHSIFGNPMIVSSSALDLLERFREPAEPNEVGVDEVSRSVVDQFVAARLLVSAGFDERAFLGQQMQEREEVVTDGSRLDYLELIMAEACNFRCTYCIHFNNLETSNRLDAGKKPITFERAKETVDKYLALLASHNKREARINFGGGEPLIAWAIMHRVLTYCREEHGTAFDFRFSINTNGSLITREIAGVLKEFGVEIAVSLDGLKDGNDQVRITGGGKGTFDVIVAGIDALFDVGYPITGIAVTVNERNFPQLDERIIDWAVARKMGDVRIDIDVIGMVEIPVEDVVERLMRLRRYAARFNLEVMGFWSRAAENLNDSTLEAHVAFCGAVRGNSLCVSPSGKIYGCGYSTTQLGEIGRFDQFTAIDGRYRRFVRDHLTGAMEMCRGCMIEGACGGGCNITQEFAWATQTMKIDRMCDFYRLMTKELLLEQLRDGLAAGIREATTSEAP